MLDRQPAGGELRLRGRSDFVVILPQDLAVDSVRSLGLHRRKYHLIGHIRRSASLLLAALSELGVGSSGHDQKTGRTPPTSLRTLESKFMNQCGMV